MTEPPRSLSDKQRAVLERLDRRMPIKVIAAELGISESRVNQHVRALKDTYGAASLGELIDRARATTVADPCRKPACRNKHLSPAPADRNQGNRFAFGGTGQTAAPSSAIEAPHGAGPGPRIVPGVFNGANAVLLRLAAIVGLAVGILVLTILSVAAALAMTEVLEERKRASTERLTTQPR